MITRQLPGFEGKYVVSDCGTVASMPRVIEYFTQSGALVAYCREGAILKPGLISSGYHSVSLCGDTHLVHRLVLKAFIGPCPVGCEVLHGNGNKLDNNLSNLRYGTRSENMVDSVKHGTHSGGRKLSKESVILIREKLALGLRSTDLAKMFDVHPNTIYYIKVGKTW